MALDFNQYSTAKPLLSGYVSWLADDLERQRLASYQLYEQIYWGAPETFKLAQRGQESSPIYVPSGRTIVETLHRYLARGLRIIPDPTLGTPNDQALATQVIGELAARERLYSKFNMNKRYGIIRGDWAWHLYANPLLPAGSRVSVMEIDPASMFPIYQDENLDNIIGWHIVEQFIDSEGKVRIRRLTYRKATGVGGPSPITMEDAIFEVDAWGGPGMSEDDEKRIQQVVPLTTLPPPIDDLPIYLIQNFQEPQALWGSSEMRGLERIMAAVNQSISDEELALAMDGLGCYSTDAGAPLDEDTGLELPWNLGPGKVVEVPAGSFFNRIAGVGSITPLQEHLRYLHEQMDHASGTMDIAKGVVDVTVAESGVALRLKFDPLLAKCEEKETVVTDVTGNLLYNLGKWYSAYEGSSFNSLWEVTKWVPLYADKLPINKQGEFENIMAMINGKIVPLTVGWKMLREIGYELPEDTIMQQELEEAASAAAQREADVLGTRIAGEVEQGGPPPTENE